jgi:hypothetical protein
MEAKTSRRSRAGAATTNYRLGEAITCVTCGAQANLYAQGWRYRSDELFTDELPVVTFFCPTCAEREFVGSS